MSEKVKATANVPDLHTILINDIKAGSKPAGQCYTVVYLADKHGVSTSTVYNHIRQVWRDGQPLFRTARGLVWGDDVTKIEQIKKELNLSVKRMASVIEANAVCPVIIKTWASSKSKDKPLIVDTAKALMGNSNAWSRTVSSVWSIVDADDDRNR